MSSPKYPSNDVRFEVESLNEFRIYPALLLLQNENLDYQKIVTAILRKIQWEDFVVIYIDSWQSGKGPFYLHDFICILDKFNRCLTEEEVESLLKQADSLGLVTKKKTNISLAIFRFPMVFNLQMIRMDKK